MIIRHHKQAEAGVEGGAAGAAAKPATEAPAAEKKEAVVDTKTVVVEKKEAAPEKKETARPEARPEVDQPRDEKGKFAQFDQTIEAARVSLASLDAKLEKQRQRTVIATLRRMGADPELVTDADLLALAPKVDPDGDDEAGARAALLKFKEGRPRWFKRAEVGPQESLAAVRERIAEDKGLSDKQKERKARMAERLLGGDQ